MCGVMLGPVLFGGGYLLYRDAVSTPRSFITDAALGIGPLPPRAVPQDWFVAVTSSVIDGGVVVLLTLAAAVLLAAVGYGRLASRLVPESGKTGAVAAAVVSVWNPFVAERLLQGQWGLLVGYAALGWIVVAVADLAAGDIRLVRWWQLGALLAVAGLTPTGSVLGLGVAVAAAGVARIRTTAGIAALWVCSAAPWLMSTALGSASISSDGQAGVRAFGLRSEPLLGPFGSALGLGGIWNADAVPTSRMSWWALVATGGLLAVTLVGSTMLWRSRSGRRLRERRMIRRLAVLAVVTVIVVAVTAFGPGQSVLGAVVDAVPGAGLLRDSQKFLALAVPFAAAATAATVVVLRRYVPAGFAFAAVALLVVAPLPDLGWAVGGRISAVTYPADWAAVAAIVPANEGSVALWPPGTVRHYRFTESPSLDPAPRMLRAPVIESGELRVDGALVDRPDSTAQRAVEVMASGDSPQKLAELGVGWVLVERDQSGRDIQGANTLPPVLVNLTPRYSGDDLILFRIDGTESPAASSADRSLVWAAHLFWLAMIVGGGAVAIAPPILRKVFSGRHCQGQ